MALPDDLPALIGLSEDGVLSAFCEVWEHERKPNMRNLETIMSDSAQANESRSLAHIEADIIAVACAIVDLSEAEAEARNEKRLANASTTKARRLSEVAFEAQRAKASRMQAQTVLFEVVKEYRLAKQRIYGDSE